MKKFVIGIIVFLVVMNVVLVGCSRVEKSQHNISEETKIETIKEEPSEELSEEEYLKGYWEAIKSKKVKQDAVSEVKELYFKDDIYNPAKVNGEIVYVDKNTGALRKVIANSSETISTSAHTALSDQIIKSSYDCTSTYSQSTGELKIWEYGKVVKTYKLPMNSIYCGYSEFEGYIFRESGNVYSAGGISKYDVEPIAHGVKFVIQTDYKLGSDPWCQPLFLMNDGSVKAYCSWEGDGAPDNESRLVDIVKDGIEGAYGH